MKEIKEVEKEKVVDFQKKLESMTLGDLNKLSIDTLSALIKEFPTTYDKKANTNPRLLMIKNEIKKRRK